MNIQQRLTALERRNDTQTEHGIPVKPFNWTDEQYNALIIGLGIRNRPFSILGLGRHFQEKYKEPIEQILSDLEQGKKPIGVLLQAEPLEFSDIIAIDKAKYFDD
jgi:hypothetical protein